MDKVAPLYGFPGNGAKRKTLSYSGTASNEQYNGQCGKILQVNMLIIANYNDVDRVQQIY